VIPPGGRMIFICLDIDSLNAPENIRHLPAKVVVVPFREQIVAMRLGHIVLKEIPLETSSHV